MTPVPYCSIFTALTPVLILVIGAFVALTLDIVRLRRSTMTVRNRTLGMVSILALLGAAVALTRQFGLPGPVTLLGQTLVVNHLTSLFNLVIVGLTILTIVISMEGDVGRHVGEYYATLLFGSIGMLLLVSTEELITIFVALELTSICLYILTAFHKGALRSQEAAVKYFMFGAISSAFLLFGLSYVYGITGTTNIREIAAQTTSSTLLSVGLLFTVVGFGFKVAVVPFHLWAPDAYEGAPTPVAAFIATGSKVASFFVLVKLLFIGFAGMQGTAFCYKFSSGWTMLLASTGAASMILGNVVAITQRNIKRLLAYSSIAHAGYVFIGFVAATEFGATSVLFYVIVYALTNLGAFGVLAALANRAGGDDMEHFAGMARRAPFLSVLMLIFFLSLAGIPPLGGFFGKFYLFAAAVQSESTKFGLLWLVILGIAMSAVSLYYYLIVLKHFYIIDGKDKSRIQTPVYLNTALAAVAVAVVLLGLFPEQVLALLKGLVAQL
ncbi:MAG: NAD(P)H-quinone oxidoreductase subunit 2, chloroplastic [Verrucomicrobiae bacterium]|nr:NAD(P)H-quinone oxidoreductase subunit 2, chloroplastic [Verrucomicrobiae bacterium]